MKTKIIIALALLISTISLQLSAHESVVNTSNSTQLYSPDTEACLSKSDYTVKSKHEEQNIQRAVENYIGNVVSQGCFPCCFCCGDDGDCCDSCKKNNSLTTNTN